MIHIAGDWKNQINVALKILKDAGIDYGPLAYYYTPTTPLPRSIIPKFKNSPVVNLSDFSTMFYIHIPFCSRRCTFCPFFLEVAQEVPDRYVESVKKHIKLFLEKYKTPKRFNLYFGGGSPNLLSISQMKSIIDSFEKGHIEEICIELHPECYNKPNYFQKLKELGINRISIGLQSTEASILNDSARGHDANVLDELIPEIKKMGFTINIDIMFGGLFGETVKAAYYTFNHVFHDLRPDWVTVYQVSIKRGTPEKSRHEKFAKNYPDTKTILKIRALRHQIASDNGYNYLFGDYFSCEQTNPRYQKKKWSEKGAVIGIGSGAYSYVIDATNAFGVIWFSPFDISEYIKIIGKHELPVERTTNLNSKSIDSWRIISGLKTEGKISKKVCKGLFYLLRRMSSLGLMHEDREGFSLSPAGILIEDLIYAVLMPIEIWEHFSEVKKNASYSPEEEKYDWFFDPNVVIKFWEYLIHTNKLSVKP